MYACVCACVCVCPFLVCSVRVCGVRVCVRVRMRQCGGRLYHLLSVLCTDMLTALKFPTWMHTSSLESLTKLPITMLDSN